MLQGLSIIGRDYVNGAVMPTHRNIVTYDPLVDAHVDDHVRQTRFDLRKRCTVKFPSEGVDLIIAMTLQAKCSLAVETINVELLVL